MKLVASLMYSAISTLVGIWVVAFAAVFSLSDNVDVTPTSALIVTLVGVVLMVVVYLAAFKSACAYIIWRTASMVFCNLGSMMVWLIISMLTVLALLGVFWHLSMWMFLEPSMPSVVSLIGTIAALMMTIILSTIFGDPAIDKTHNFIEQRMFKQ